LLLCICIVSVLFGVNFDRDGRMNVLAKILEWDGEEMGPKEQPEVGFVGLATDNRIGRLRLDPDPVQVFANHHFRCGCGVHGGKCRSCCREAFSGGNNC